MTDSVRYSGTITWRDEPVVHAAVLCAAKAHRTKPAEWLRQAVRFKLRLDGIDPAANPPSDQDAA